MVFVRCRSLDRVQWALKGMGNLVGYLARLLLRCGIAFGAFQCQILAWSIATVQVLPQESARCGFGRWFYLLMDDLVFGVDVRWYVWSVALFAGLTMVTNVQFL